MENFYDLTSQYLNAGNFLAYFFVYLAGILASLSPCIYPIIPSTVAYFGSQGDKKWSSILLLAIAYVIGMSITYSVLGMIAALTGNLFGKIASHYITLFIFANICLFFGLCMLEIMPPAISYFVTGPIIGPSKKKGIIGSFVFGASSGLIVSPCTTPILGTLLVYIAGERDIIFAATLLFVFSLGMCTLLLALAISSKLLSLLPKSGLWMLKLKKIAGFIMILFAEYLLIKSGMAML